MAVKMSDLKEWGIVKKLNDMMCDELFGPEKRMTDDLVERLRNKYASPQDAASAADRIEELERELAEERHSREVAADKAWKFSDRIIELELELKETEGTIWSLHKTIEDISNRGNK